MELLPQTLEKKRRALERVLGRPVVVRGICTTDQWLRGRLRVEASRVVIEYQVSEHGYFWHIPIIEELFSRAGAGHLTAELREFGHDCEEQPQGR